MAVHFSGRAEWVVVGWVGVVVVAGLGLRLLGGVYRLGINSAGKDNRCFNDYCNNMTNYQHLTELLYS